MATNRRLLDAGKGPLRDLDAERKKANELEAAALTNTLIYGNAYNPLQRKSILKKDLVTGDVRIQTPKETKETDTALQKIGNEQKQREEAKNSGTNVSKIKWKQSVVDHSTNNDTSAYTDFTDSVIKNTRESRKTEYDYNKKLEDTRKERSDYFRLKSGWKSENSPKDAVNVDAYTSYDSTKPTSKDDVITAGNELAEKVRNGTATDDDYRKYVNTEALYGEGMYNAFNDRISVTGRSYGVVSDDDIWKNQNDYEAEATALYGDINALFEKYARGEATDAELNAMGARKKKFDEREKVYLSDEWSRRGTIESTETLKRRRDEAKKAYDKTYVFESDGPIAQSKGYYPTGTVEEKTYNEAEEKYKRAFAADSYKKIEDTYDEYKKEMTASGYKFNGVMENGGQVSYGNTYSDFVSKMYNQNASEGEDYHVDELRDYGTEEQKAVFTYLYQTKGREAALKYSLEINPIIAEQAYKANKKKYEDSGFWGRLGMGISDSFMGGLAGDFIYNMEGVGRLLTGDTSYHFQNVAQQKANAVSEAEENPVAKFGMAALRTTGAQTPMIITSMATGGASGILGNTSSVLFFASAAGSSYSESINKGNGWFESVGYGTTVAAFELLTEKIFDVPGIYGGSKVDDAVKGALSKGIGRLSTSGKTKSALTFAGYLGVNALGEGFEEGVAELFSPVWSNLWLGEQNAMFTEEHWKEIGYASLLGMASSFLMAGPSMPYLYSEAKGNTAVWSILNGKAKSVYEIDAVLNNESSKKLFEKVIGIELSDNTDVARMQVAAVSSAVSAWYAKNSGKKVSDLMKTLTVSDAGSVAEFVEKAAEVIPEPDAEYIANETAAVAEMTEIANKELKKTTVDEKAVPETAADGIKIDEDGSVLLPTAAEEWDAALKRSEAETLLYLKKLDASVLADGGVSTTELSDLLKDKNTARSIFVEYSKSHFPSSITNLETGHEIGISRNGIDKFLSGNISKEKYATGLKIPQLVESAHKVAEADNKKGKAGISGYEYYENKIKVDGNDYNVYIRVRNTDMGDRYYGHTIGKAVEDIKIEPSAWNSDGDTSVHSINALDSNNIIPQRTPGVKMANDGSIMLPTAEGEINAAAANKKDILPGFSDVTTETTEMTGRACGVSEENIGIAVRLSHALGVKVAFYEDLNSDERGQYFPKTGVIWVNSKYQDVFSNVFGHELTHKIESSKFYKALDRFVAGKLKAEGKSMDELIRRKKESYSRRGVSLSDEAARREVVAKYVGEVLLNNEAVIADIANTDSGLGGFLLSKIDSLVSKITGKNKEAVYIRRVQQMFRKALEDVSRKEGAKVPDGSKQQRGSVYEDAGLNELAERYRRGDLSQAEYLEAYNEYMEQNPGIEDEDFFEGRSFDLDEGKRSPITKDMSDAERAEILKNTEVVIAEPDADTQILTKDMLNEVVDKTSIRDTSHLKTLAEEYGVISQEGFESKKYYIPAIGLEVEFSRRDFNESAEKQKGDYDTFAELLPVFKQTIENSQLIKENNDRYEMVVYPDHIIDSMYVLISAFRSSDGNVVPVKLEVKKNVHNNDSLYIVVTHGDKTKNGTFAPASGAGENIVSHTRHSNKSSSVITIPQILDSVNSNFEGLVKYFPDEMLTIEQQFQKKKELVEEEEYIKNKATAEWNKQDKRYKNAVEQNDLRRVKTSLYHAREMRKYTEKSENNILRKPGNPYEKLNEVTYDDDGNLIPLSKRYDDKNPDRRYDFDDANDFADDEAYMDAVNRGDMDTAQRLVEKAPITPAKDAEYLELAKNPEKNDAKLREMVDEAAKNAGYTDDLFHGTKQFGFTVFDTQMSDDKISIFAAGSDDIAQTYSGVYGSKSLTNIDSVDDLSVEEVVDKLNELSEHDNDEMQNEYLIMHMPDVNKLIKDVNSGIDELQSIVENEIVKFADRMATDFNEKDFKTHKQLIDLKDILQNYQYEYMSTPIYMLLHHSDAFREGVDASKIAVLEANIRLMNRLANTDVSDGVVVNKQLGGYGISILSFDDAKTELKYKLLSGNYALYGYPGNQYVVDCKGHNWNDITYYEVLDDDLKRFYPHGLWRHGTTRDVAKYAKSMGFNSVKFENVFDNGGRGEDTEAGTVYAYFNPNDLKSADVVTYDNKGNVIPLSKRFNYNKSDIRYDFDDANDFADDEMLYDSSFAAKYDPNNSERSKAIRKEREKRKAERKADEFSSRGLEGKDWWSKNRNKADRMFNKRELERLAKIKSELEDADELTVEQVTALWGEMRKLQRNVTAMSMAHQITNEELTQVTDLLRGDRTIEDIEKLPADRYNINGIIAVAKAKLEYENVASQIREYKARHKARLYEVADGYVAGNVIDDKKGPAAGLRYRRETMERNVRDVVKDKGKAEGIIDEYFKPVHKNEADRTRFKEKLRDRIRKLGISTKVEKGNQVSEAYAVQFYGEVADHIAYLEQNQNRVKHREGKNLEEWRALEKALWEDNPNLDKGKIERAVEEFRKIYDELYQNMNEVRVRNGYEPVKYRRGYFPHFAPGTSDGVLAKIAKGLGINSEVTDLPTTINGLTHTFKPGIKWMGNILERTGFATEYDALTGFDRYLEAASDVIYHTDDIQKLRALSTRIRYNAGDEGIKKQADEIKSREGLSDAEKQTLLDELYKDGKFNGSNFTVVLDDYTNILAGKKSISDRNAEYNLGRKMYNVVKGLESRIAANMIAGNLASALTNFIPITQAASVLDPKVMTVAAYKTLQSMINGGDGIQDTSDFLTNRRGSDLLALKTSEKISKALSKPMEFIDSFASGTIVRARFYDNLQRGMSEDAALEEADSFAASVIADRSKGSMPVLFEQKNPLVKLFTQFQLEVNNQLSFATKDLWRDESAKAEHGKNALTDKAVLRYAFALFRFALMAFLFDELYEWLIGRRPALDPIGMIVDYAEDAQEDGAFEALGGLGEDVATNMPFIGGLMGGGRVPISSALPDIGKIYSSLSGDSDAKKKASVIAKEFTRPLVYLVPPFGGGAVKKIVEGVDAITKGGSYTVDTEGREVMQYPVYNDSVGGAIMNGAGAVLFGKTSTEGGKKWIKDGFKSFSADYTEAYKGMIELDGVTQKEAYEFLDGLRGIKDEDKTDDVSVNDLKRQYIEESGIDDSAKGIAFYYSLANDKEKEFMYTYRDSEEFGAISGVLMGMKEHGNSVQPKRELLLESELDSDVKRDIYESIIVSSDDKEKESAKIDAFEDAGMTVDDYLSCRNKKYELDNDDGLNASGRATEFARWVDNNFKPKQAGIIKENVKFSSGFSVSADGYEKYREAGLSPDEAYNLINGFGELEPEDGKEQVSDWQKARVIVDGDLSDEDKLTSLGVVLSSGTYERVSTAYDKGISFERYFDVKDEYDSRKEKYSADEKDAYADRWNSTHGRTSGKTKLTFNQIMMYEAIEGIGGDLTASGGIMTTAPKYSFTKRDKAVLWQILDGEWSHEKNPFDTSVGLDVRKSMGWVD